MIRRAALWSFSSQIASFVVQFGGSVLLARLLSPKELGVYAVALALMGIVQLFASFGVAQFIIREETLDSDTLHTAFTINTIISFLLAASIFCLSYLGGSFLHDDGVTQVLRWLALAPIISIPTFRPGVILQRAMQLRGISILGTASTFITTFITVLCAALNYSYMSPAYGALAGTIFGSAGTLVVGRRHLGMRLTLKRWRPITGFGLRLMSIGGIAAASVRLSDVILGHLLGLSALGLYSRATNLSNILFGNVYGAATKVVFAKLSQARRDGDRVTEVYLLGYRIITGIMAPLLLGLAVFSHPLVQTLYGPRWLGAATPLGLLLVAQFVSLTFAMNWELFVVRDELKAQTRLEIIRSVIGLISQTIGCFFGLVIVAASSIFDAIVSFAIYQPHMPRLARAPQSIFYKLYAEALLLATVAAGPGFLLMTIYGWSATTPLPYIFASAALGCSFWFGALIISRHPILAEIDRLRAKLIGSRLARMTAYH